MVEKTEKVSTVIKASGDALKQKLTMKKRQTNVDSIDVVMPRLVQGVKAWFIEYSCYCPKTGKLEKFRDYKGFKKLVTEKEKHKLATKKISLLTKQLKAGWRPWDSSVYLYKDEIQYKSDTNAFGNKKYNNSHIRKYLSDFLTELKRNVSAKTYESYQSKTRLFCKWLEENDNGKIRIYEITDEITKKFFDYLIDTKKLDTRTIEKYKQNLSQMFKYFQKRKLIDAIPLNNISKPVKVKDMAARPIMDNDLKTFLTAMAEKDPQLLLASLMQFFLCCRPGNELRLLQVFDIDFYARIIRITEGNGKTGKRIITMPEALVELLLKYRIDQHPGEYYVFSKDGKPGKIALGKNYFTRRFAKLRDDMKLSKLYKFYSFKHTGAGKLLESGATIAEIMSHLGHVSVESTMAYIRRHFGEKSEKVLNFRPDVLKGII